MRPSSWTLKSTGLYVTDRWLRRTAFKAELLKDRALLHESSRTTISARSPVSRNPAYYVLQQAVLAARYDDGLVSALAICDMLDRRPRGERMSELKDARCEDLGSPTMSPHLRRRRPSYGIVDQACEALPGVAGQG